MEREFGSEIVRTFGVRLQRIYQPEQANLPAQMTKCLEQLKRAEAEGVAADRQQRDNDRLR
jgi:hypothetical protein